MDLVVQDCPDGSKNLRILLRDAREVFMKREDADWVEVLESGRWKPATLCPPPDARSFPCHGMWARVGGDGPKKHFARFRALPPGFSPKEKEKPKEETSHAKARAKSPERSSSVRREPLDFGTVLRRAAQAAGGVEALKERLKAS